MNHHDKAAITANLITAKKIAEKNKQDEAQKQAAESAYTTAEASIAEAPITQPPRRPRESWTVATSETVRETKKADAPVIAPAKVPSSVSKHYEEQISSRYGQMLGVEATEITNLSLYQFIDKWLGADYRLGGCDISGIDCSGFAQKLYAEIYGMDLVRTALEQFHNCKRIKHAKDATEGDLVFFRVHSRRITHVGVYLMNNYFVHASSSQGVVISNLNEEYWHKYYAGCGRIPRGE